MNFGLRLLTIAIVATATLANAEDSEETWWSLRPLTMPAVPLGDDWCGNEIDRFVLAKLTEKGLTPSAEADPRTLIRRLTYDLTGLPPTEREIEDFVQAHIQDPKSSILNAADRLLASPRYGEHWARHWLDVARYGESHGYDKDKARFDAWPYRDYVIRSFNQDKPWSRFVREQVAGDILYPGSKDGIVALGFLAAGPWDFIAHVEVGEAKVDGRIAKHLDRDDMVAATFNAFMSTTAQCAQCHDHKFDPVTMEDYYRLHSVFAAVDRASRSYGSDPKFAGRRAELEAEIAALETERKGITEMINEKGGEPLAALRKEVAELEKAKNVGVRTVPEHGYHSQIVDDPDEQKWVQVELAKAEPVTEIRLIASHDTYNGIGAGFGFPVRFKVESAPGPTFSDNVKVLADFTGDDFPNPGLGPVVIDATGSAAQYIRLTATRLAERKDDYIFALAELEIIGTGGTNLATGAKVTSKDSIEAPTRWARSNLTDGKFSSAADPEIEKKWELRRKEMRETITDLGSPEINERRPEIDRRLADARNEIAAVPVGNTVYAVATDFKSEGKFQPTKGNPRPVQLLHRGDIRNPGDPMAPGAPPLWRTPPVFDLPENHPEGDRRAALAEYLTDPQNPLLWRSIANRVWLYHMGRGIVESPNDFGRMGALPTHPELLDWLAATLRDDPEESLKKIHRLIVTSATYRQSSGHDSNKATKDQSNTCYWRMTRRKLSAEELRDSILSVSQALDLKMGGPSFRDFEFKDDHTPKFYYDRHDPSDPNSHRRTIYRFIARSQTHPFLTVLDCADPSQMVAKRDETTTALQALSLMNNPFMLTMSERLAQRADTVTQAVRLTLNRDPTDRELQTLTTYAKKHGLPATCRLLFNLNEFAYID